MANAQTLGGTSVSAEAEEDTVQRVTGSIRRLGIDLGQERAGDERVLAERLQSSVNACRLDLTAFP